MQSGQWEASIVVVEANIRPFGGFMTRSAIRSKLTVVLILGSMTGITILWCAFVYIIDVA